MSKLTIKQEKFIQGIISGLSQREAYKKAYNATKMKDETIDIKASQLFKKGKVRVRYEELLKEFKDKALYTREKAVEDLVWIKEKAKAEIKEIGIKQANGTIFINSIKEVANLANLYVKDEEIKVDDKPFELPARVIAPSFLEVHFDIMDKGHKEYVLDGGRGSTKSTFVGLEIINLIKNNPNIHALATRKVADTLRDSVYAQIKWAIEILGLENEFRCGLSPLEIEYLPTKQKIYFRGADDPVKIKSIKPAFGYIGILWLEELDQFKGPEAVRSIEQSAIRGGDEAYIFKTFNPPKTANNWANKYIKIPKENQFQKHTTYLEVPQKWLGKTFIDEAEHLKNVNPKAYEHEYLGVANGNGGNVFENVTIRTITDDEIKEFDRLHFGLDFGWFPDPNAYTKMYYNASQRKLYIFDEFRSNKMANKDLANILIKEKGLTPNDKLVCDSADNKSIADLKSYGLFTRGAEKGPGSVDYSIKWLASLTEIIIDNSRCPHTAQEFLDYEYERTKDGEIISSYPDKDNHFIDSVRYATNEIWKRRGQ